MSFALTREQLEIRAAARDDRKTVLERDVPRPPRR